MLTIGQFSKASLVPSKTLRYYDEIGLLKPKHVDPVNGYRYYEVNQLEKTMKILMLKEFEFSLSDIQEVMEDERKLLPLLESKKQEILSKLTSYVSVQNSIEYYMKELTQGGSMMNNLDISKVKTVMGPELNLVSVRETIDVANFEDLFTRAFKLLEQSKQVPTGAPTALYHSEEYTPENYDVEIGFPIKDSSMSNHVINSSECAYFEFTGNYQNLGEAYATLTKWIDMNNYRMNGAPFEQYVTDPEKVKPDDNQVNVYMPIIKKEK